MFGADQTYVRCTVAYLGNLATVVESGKMGQSLNGKKNCKQSLYLPDGAVGHAAITSMCWRNGKRQKSILGCIT